MDNNYAITDDLDKNRKENKDPIDEALQTSSKFVMQDSAAMR